MAGCGRLTETKDPVARDVRPGPAAPAAGTRLGTVPKVVVDVMPKPEILDPQGKAVLGALPRLGFSGVTEVRQGKRFELELSDEVTDEVLDQVRLMAETLLSNPVIESFAISVDGERVTA